MEGTKFGDKETTMYVDSIVHICNRSINVVFVNPLLKKHHLLSEIKSWIPFHRKSGLEIELGPSRQLLRQLIPFDYTYQMR